MSDNLIKRQRITKIIREKTPESNKSISIALLLFSGIAFMVWLLFQLGIFKSKGIFITSALLLTPIIFIAVSVICLLREGNGTAFQYIFFPLLALFWLELELMSGYKSKLLLAILIVLSLKYYNKKFTIFTYFISLLSLAGSIFCNAFLYQETGLVDLNTVSLSGLHNIYVTGFIYDNIIALNPSSLTILRNGFLLLFIPNLIFLTAILVISLRFMKSNLENLLEIKEMYSKEAERKAELVDMKTKVMLSQVKPHFLYNTLSSIALFCIRDPERAKKLTIDFSKYLRNNLDSLNNNDNSITSFTDELDHIKTYLAIELVRFEDRLNVEYDIKATGFSLPSLSIQPIVENAVKHGVSKKTDGGTVKISTYEEENNYVIVVSDDGIGFDKDTMYADCKEHVGVTNITHRIQLFGGTLDLESEVGKGTVATVKIPKEGPQK